MKKDDRITEAGTAADSNIQPIVTTSASIEANPMLCDVFSSAVLKTLNSVYKKFSLINNEGNIYAFGYDGKNFEKPLPKEGGDLMVCYPEKDVVIVDKSCVKPFSKEYLDSHNGWRKDYEDADVLLGYTAGCKIFADYVKAGH